MCPRSAVFAGMTVWENLLMGAHILRDTAEVRRRAAGVAERFPIVNERRRDRAGSLSGGQQKIVEIARALMLEPRLILMDEPSMGLDPKARRLVFETITGLNRDHGHTILLVEQNARAGLGIAHRGAVMDAGAVAIAAHLNVELGEDNLSEFASGEVHCRFQHGQAERSGAEG